MKSVPASFCRDADCHRPSAQSPVTSCQRPGLHLMPAPGALLSPPPLNCNFSRSFPTQSVSPKFRRTEHAATNIRLLAATNSSTSRLQIAHS